MNQLGTRIRQRDIGVKRTHLSGCILSGGLHPENVEAAIATVYPYAVDVASGTEAEPGRKDPQRLADFAAAVARTGDPEAEEDLEAVIAEVTEGTE